MAIELLLEGIAVDADCIDLHLDGVAIECRYGYELHLDDMVIELCGVYGEGHRGGAVPGLLQNQGRPDAMSVCRVAAG